MSSQQPQRPKVTFREAIMMAEEAGKLSADPLFNSSDSQPDALHTPGPGQETGEKETGQKRSVAEMQPKSPLNPKRQKQEDHDDDWTARELFTGTPEALSGRDAQELLLEVLALDGPESPEDSETASDATTLKMQGLVGSDAEDEVTEVEKVQVPVGSDDPLIWPRELSGADPLIVEATEPQPGDPEIDGGEMVLEEPPPSRSNDEAGRPNREEPQFFCDFEIYGGEMVLDEPPPSRSNDEAGRPNREDAAPKKYGCSKCRWKRTGCAQCLRYAVANKRGYVLDSMGIPYRPNAQ